MTKRFKARKRKKINKLKIIIIIILIYIFYKITYQILFKNYISKLSSDQIIKEVIKENITKYTDIDYIIDNNFKKYEITKTVNKPITIKHKIYIYNTHDTESYSDKYLENYNIIPTVKNMSTILADYLTDYGIETTVEKNSIAKILKDNKWSYRRSYDASRKLIEKNIKENNYDLIIDLHRDSSNINKTLLEYNNKKYAKILFVVGLEHDNYEKNLNISKKLNDLLEKEIPGITRGISKKAGPGVNGIYNQDLNPNCILIELGGKDNEINELNNTLEILAKVLLKYTEGEQ